MLGISLTLFKIGYFGAAHGEGQKDLPLPKICHTYPKMIKLGTVIPYLKKIQKTKGQKRYQQSATFADIMQFDKMLQNFFNCTYRGSMSYQLELLNLSPIGHLTITINC